MTKTNLKKAAQLKGFTRYVEIETGEYSLIGLVKPYVDFDSSFKFFCLDEFEFLIVNGWQAANIEG